MNKSMSGGLIALGVVAIAAALILGLVVVPEMKVFPDDVDTTRTYTVEYLTLLDPVTMTFDHYDLENNPDLHIVRNVRVEKVDGDTTLVREEKEIRNGEDVIIAQLLHYPLDRKSMEHLEEGDFSDEWEDMEGYWERSGLVIGWGIDVEKRDYTGWSDDYRDNVTLAYQGREKHDGVTTYYFTSESESIPMDDDHIAFLGMPTELDIEQVKALAAELPIEDETSKRLASVMMPRWLEEAVREHEGLADDDPVMVPLAYYYDYFGEYWVDPDTGVLIDTHKRETRTVTFPPYIMEYLYGELEAMGRDPAGLDDIIPLEVNSFYYEATPEAVEDAKEDAEEGGSLLTLFGATVPMALAFIGVLLIGGGGIGLVQLSYNERNGTFSA